jgi:hypothetical protein
LKLSASFASIPVIKNAIKNIAKIALALSLFDPPQGRRQRLAVV